MFPMQVHSSLAQRGLVFSRFLRRFAENTHRRIPRALCGLAPFPENLSKRFEEYFLQIEMEEQHQNERGNCS